MLVSASASASTIARSTLSFSAPVRPVGRWKPGVSREETRARLASFKDRLVALLAEPDCHTWSSNGIYWTGSHQRGIRIGIPGVQLRTWNDVRNAWAGKPTPYGTQQSTWMALRDATNDSTAPPPPPAASPPEEQSGVGTMGALSIESMQNLFNMLSGQGPPPV